MLLMYHRQDRWCRRGDESVGAQPTVLCSLLFLILGFDYWQLEAQRVNRRKLVRLVLHFTLCFLFLFLSFTILLRVHKLKRFPHFFCGRSNQDATLGLDTSTTSPWVLRIWGKEACVANGCLKKAATRCHLMTQPGGSPEPWQSQIIFTQDTGRQWHGVDKILLKNIRRAMRLSRSRGHSN